MIMAAKSQPTLSYKRLFIFASNLCLRAYLNPKDHCYIFYSDSCSKCIPTTLINYKPKTVDFLYIGVHGNVMYGTGHRNLAQVTAKCLICQALQ